MMASTGHTIKAFDEELDALRATIAEMGGLAEEAIREAMAALVRRDADAAAQVVERDRRIDALEAEIERQAVQIIALRAPMADDLREVVAALKIAGVVERIGDYAKNIAKRVPSVEDSKIRPLSLLPEMARIAGEMVHNVLDAFAQRDAKKAEAVVARDAAVDDFYNSIFRSLLTHMMENPHNITPATHLLFVAKNLERIGDHATNVAEMVYFAATGAHLGDRTKGADATTIAAGDLEAGSDG
jgi:phosphate transport system protein